MTRLEFLQLSLGMSTLHTLSAFASELKDSARPMPVLFLGHGSPMNGIEDNAYSQSWEKLGKSIPLPKAVLCISAHWLTKGTRVTAMEKPRTIHDFGGFPQALFDVQYPAPGSPEIAKQVQTEVHSIQVHSDHEWGLDHGTWSVVKRMYPEANVPVLQLSIDYAKGPQYHYNLAKELNALRRKGILIIGSGNMVHNLGIISWKGGENYGYDWAKEINTRFKELINSGKHDNLIHYEKLGKAANLAIPTPDHYYPLLYTLGLQEKTDPIRIFNDTVTMGSISMTSVQFG